MATAAKLTPNSLAAPPVGVEAGGFVAVGETPPVVLVLLLVDAPEEGSDSEAPSVTFFQSLTPYC